jgi:hypothetical protein
LYVVLALLQADQLRSQLSSSIQAAEAAKADAQREKARADAAEAGQEEKLAALVQQVEALNTKVRRSAGSLLFLAKLLQGQHLRHNILLQFLQGIAQGV